MLHLVLMQAEQLEFRDIRVHEKFVVEVPKGGHAHERCRWCERGGQTRRGSKLRRPVPRWCRGTDLVKRGRIVDLKTGLHRQDLVEGQWGSLLAVDIARHQQVRPAVEDHSELAPRRGDVVAPKRVVRMFEVADIAVLDTSQ